MKKLVILISGRGSNMQAIVAMRPRVPVAAVISNEPAAAGLAFAKGEGITTRVVNHRDYSDRPSFDHALGEVVDGFAPDLVVLGGFMRILTDAFVQRYHGRLLNIHPSLLPAFPGLHTHRRALEAGCRVHGCTVHFVTAQLDHGPIVIQAAIPVLPGDTEDTLAVRVLEQEHRIYPQAVRWFCDGQLVLTSQGTVRLDPERPAAGNLVSPRPDP